MPNWKKLITSGSDASLNTLAVSNTLIAPNIFGDLTGTSSYAITASHYVTSSYSQTASVVLSNEGLPKRFILEEENYKILAGLEGRLDNMYNYGYINNSSASVYYSLGLETINDEGHLIVDNIFYNIGIFDNGGTLTIGTR
jgi:hypothetical protein